VSEPTFKVWSDGRRFYDTREVAKIIRIVLKRDFPKTKFGVRMRTYAGGSSIDIFYDGKARQAPKKDDVTKLTCNYVNHDFDGMTDSSISLDHWMMPDYSATVANRGAMTFDKAIHTKKPHKDAVLTLFGAGFVFVNDYVEVRTHLDGTETRCPA